MVNHGYAIPDTAQTPFTTARFDGNEGKCANSIAVAPESDGIRIPKDHSEGADGYNLETRKCGNYDNGKEGRASTAPRKCQPRLDVYEKTWKGRRSRLMCVDSIRNTYQYNGFESVFALRIICICIWTAAFS
jgi:hypothetical protein